MLKLSKLINKTLQNKNKLYQITSISSSRIFLHDHNDNIDNNNFITIHWKNKNNEIKTTQAKLGSSLLQVAHREEIDLEGACGGVCACSTCHVILQPEIFENLPNPSEEEEDMLDLAFGLTSTSRLGCQIILDKSHDQMIVQLPAATRNFYVDGHVPKPH